MLEDFHAGHHIKCPWLLCQQGFSSAVLVLQLPSGQSEAWIQPGMALSSFDVCWSRVNAECVSSKACKCLIATRSDPRVTPDSQRGLRRTSAKMPPPQPTSRTDLPLSSDAL